MTAGQSTPTASVTADRLSRMSLLEIAIEHGGMGLSADEDLRDDH